MLSRAAQLLLLAVEVAGVRAAAAEASSVDIVIRPRSGLQGVRIGRRGSNFALHLEEAGESLTAESRGAAGRVVASSPSASALQALGLDEGDELTQVDGTRVSSQSLQEWLALEGSQGSAVVFPIVGADASEEDAGDSQQRQEEAVGEGGAGLGLRGFLKLEWVAVEDASVVFQPVGERRERLEALALADKQRKAQEFLKQQQQQQQQQQVEAAKDKGAGGKQEQKQQEEGQEKDAPFAGREAERKKNEERNKAEEKARERAEEQRKAETKAAQAAVRRAEAIAKERASKDFVQMRKEGKGFVYTAQFTEVGPMGLTFDLQSNVSLVSEVGPSSPSWHLGIVVGDYLVGVNDENTAELAPTDALKLLSKAMWPRTLAFEVKEKEVESEKEQWALFVASPALVRGEYLTMPPKEWGRDKPPPGCHPIPMALTDPIPACDSSTRVVNVSPSVQADAESSGALVMVRRGKCTFVDKSKHVQSALAAMQGVAMPVGTTDADGEEEPPPPPVMGGGMVVINTDNELVDMPKGKQETTGLGIPVAMIAASNGTAVEMLLKWSHPVIASLGPIGGCSEAPPLALTVQRRAPGGEEKTPRARPQSDPGGRLHIHSEKGEMAFDYHLASYGPQELGERPVAVVVADPFDGCEESAFTVRVAGAWVAVQRGVCSFGIKTIAAQSLGAKGVIIVNTEPATTRPMASKGEEDKVTIPTVMVTSSAGEYLMEAFEGRGVIMGRFFPEDTYGMWG